MAEKLCTLRTKGGGGGAKYTETVLWTNSSPTSSFSPQTITLSDDINNYEYIGVKFNTDTKGTTPSTAIMSVTDYKKGVNTGTSGRRDVLSIASQIATEGNYYSRRVSYVSDTSANISAAKLYGSSTTSNTDVIPIQVVGIKKGRVPSYKTVKDFIYDKVFNSGLPEITTYTIYQNRVTMREGKIVADAVTHKVYMYFDFTTNMAIGSASDWAGILTLTSTISNYLPVFMTNSRANNIPLITDDLSDIPTKQFACGYGSESFPYRFFLSYGSTAQANEHYIVYAEYTYK